MSIVLADRVQETTTTIGTGTISLGGPVAQFQSFLSGVGNGNQTYYCLVNGNSWEVGIGTVTAGSPNTLSRTTILASSNSGSTISLSGTSTVFGDAPAALLSILANGTTGSGEVVLAASPTITGTLDVSLLNVGSGAQAGREGVLLNVRPGTDQNFIVSGPSYLPGGVTLQSINDAFNAYEEMEIVATTLDLNITNFEVNGRPFSFPVNPDTLAGLGQNQTWTGSNFFKNGMPWADVRAWGATGNGSTDDTTAIQNAINFMESTYAGGIVFFPPGYYYVPGGLTLGGSAVSGTNLVGCGRECTVITVGSTNISAVTFGNDCVGAGARDLSIYGTNSGGSPVSSAGASAVVINQNVGVTLSHCNIWFGSWALTTSGVDNTYEDCFIADGYFGAVYSFGANWYIRCKLDTRAPSGYNPTTYGFVMNQPFTGASSSENHFIQCDFSGVYTYSVLIQDPSNQAYSIFQGCVFANGVNITGHKWTCITEGEMGGDLIANVGVVTVANSFGVSAVAHSGAATWQLSNNYNIT